MQISILTTGNSYTFEIEVIRLDLFEIELFQSEYLSNRQFGKAHIISASGEKADSSYIRSCMGKLPKKKKGAKLSDSFRQ